MLHINKGEIMKFEFKEGQWFDVRKLTDWQKQWGLGNIIFTKYARKMMENEGVYRYRYKGESFMSTSPDFIHPKDELTFNDFYWEDEEVTQESIFDNPRWVTSKRDMELSQGLELISGKDYKVVETIIDADGDKLFKIINSLGVLRSYHESHFHKVTPQDLLPDEIEEVEDSFDNLVYVQPKHIDNNTYYVVEKGKLSESQWEFLLGNVPLEYEPEDNEIYLNLDPNARKWFGDTYKSENQDIYISFNDLFQEVN